MLKAVERFDPSREIAFTTFAVPTILGEIRRHFRDAAWAVKVPRRAKELNHAIARAVEDLWQSLGRSPRPAEIAERIAVDLDTVLEAMEAGACYRTMPLTPPTSGDDDGDLDTDSVALGRAEPGFEVADARLAVADALERLPARERTIVELRFFDGLTQAEIAARIGYSQVHVSRLLRASLVRLQRVLDADGVTR